MPTARPAPQTPPTVRPYAQGRRLLLLPRVVAGYIPLQSSPKLLYSAHSLAARLLQPYHALKAAIVQQVIGALQVVYAGRLWTIHQEHPQESPVS